MFELKTASAASKPRIISYGAAALDGIGSNAAPLQIISGTNISMAVRAFDDTTEEFVSGSFFVPNDIPVVGDVTLKVVGLPLTAADAKNVSYRFAHCPVGDGEDYDASLTNVDSGDKALSYTASEDDVSVHTWTASLATLGWNTGDVIFFKLSRRQASASDLSGDLLVQSFSVIFPE